MLARLNLLSLGALVLLHTSPIQATKRGLAINDDIPITAFADSQISWFYNWDSTTNQAQPWAQYMPMLWNTSPDHTNVWFERANNWLSSGATDHLLAFNEPERSDQAAMSADDAAAAYRQWMQPFAGAQLGSPAVSNDGYDWMNQFMGLCGDCVINFVATHWYNDHTLIEDFKNWVNGMCALAGGRPLWITEFGAYGSIEEQIAFLDAALPWLDANPCVERYAYFGSADNNQVMMDGSGLSALGQRYAFL